MQKLKNKVLDKMLHSGLTKAEVDFLLEISHYQDDSGKIYGVYYKDICKAIDISYETFYVTMRALADKNLISVKKDFYGDWDITIQDNDFSYPEALKEGYVSTGHDIFYNKEFCKMKANEKLLIMQLLKICGAGSRYHIGEDLFYKTYTELLRVSIRTLQLYLSKLKLFFSIRIKDKQFWITPLMEIFKYGAPRDIQNFSCHLSRVACRRNRATYTEESLKDIANLVKQYIQSLKQDIAQVFLLSVQQSIERKNESIANKSKWKREINPKFVHKLMRNIIASH